MLIAAYAIGAREGYIYVRAEYPLRYACEEGSGGCHSARPSGRKDSRTDFSLNIKIKEVPGPSCVVRRQPSSPRSKDAAACLDLAALSSGEWLWANRPTSTTWRPLPMFAYHPQGADWYASLARKRARAPRFLRWQARSTTRPCRGPMGITLERIIFDVGGASLEERSSKLLRPEGRPEGAFPLLCSTSRSTTIH